MSRKKHETPEDVERRRKYHREYARAHRHINRDARNAARREWRRTHPVKDIELARAKKRVSEKRRRDKHRERLNAIARSRYVNIPSEKARRAEYHRRHYQANKEKTCATAKLWRKKNIEKVKEFAKLYYKEKRHVFTASHQARRAAKAGCPISDKKAILNFMQRTRRKNRVMCYYCGAKVQGTSIEFDHVVPISKGGAHSISNLCVTCPTCNRHKSAILLGDWQPSSSQPVLPF